MKRLILSKTFNPLKNFVTVNRAKHSFDKNLAFTLSEVLITLGVIGVVAALGIPALMNSTNDAELKAAWKKEFSTFSQVTTQIASENGGSLKNACTHVGFVADSQCLMNLFKDHLNVQKYCLSVGGTFRDCWFKSTPSIESHQMDGTSDYVVWSPGYPGMILNDGTLVVFYGGNASCTGISRIDNECVMAVLDINGFKLPNVIGKDIFTIHIYDNKIEPGGAQNTDYSNDCSPNPPSGTGYGCAAQYLYN